MLLAYMVFFFHVYIGYTWQKFFPMLAVASIHTSTPHSFLNAIAEFWPYSVMKSLFDQQSDGLALTTLVEFAIS